MNDVGRTIILDLDESFPLERVPSYISFPLSTTPVFPGALLATSSTGSTCCFYCHYDCHQATSSALIQHVGVGVISRFSHLQTAKSESGCQRSGWNGPKHKPLAPPGPTGLARERRGRLAISPLRSTDLTGRLAISRDKIARSLAIPRFHHRVHWRHRPPSSSGSQ
jgi:hypothetical protein